MEVNKGFQSTEIGVIPSDWKVLSIGEAFDICNNLRLPISEDIRKTMQGAYPYYGPTKIQDYINEYRVDGEYALIGEDGDHFLKWKEMPMTQLTQGKFNVNNHAHLIKGKHNISLTSWFYFYFKNSDITQHLTRQGAGRYKLSKGTLVKIPCALPPTLQEQTAIATALSDTDALITNLEKLIAKKRNIKQGAMQELLKPKRGWIDKKLPDVVWFQEGPGVRNNQFTNSGVKLLNGTNIENGKLRLEKTDRFISEKEAFGWYSHFLVQEGDILIACSGVTIDKFEEKVTQANTVHLPLCMNTSTMRFKVTSSSLSKNYFLHFLKSRLFKEQISGKATGSAQLNFGPSHVSMVHIAMPSTEEQIEIANVLSAMDSEIALLESKLDKYMNVKFGMMQNLLTGKIRLV